MNVAIALLVAIGVLVVVYCVLSLPRWLHELVDEEHEAESARVDAVLDDYSPQPIHAAPAPPGIPPEFLGRPARRADRGGIIVSEPQEIDPDLVE